MLADPKTRKEKKAIEFASGYKKRAAHHVLDIEVTAGDHVLEEKKPHASQERRRHMNIEELHQQ